MSRAPLNNPVIPSEDTEELYRSMQDLIDQLERRADQTGQMLVVPLLGITGGTQVHLIARVGKEGFELGRVSFTLGVDITADSSNYWIFTLSRYFTAYDGVRTNREIPTATWNTSTTGVRAHVPTVLELQRPLDPGETLVLDIAETGTATSFSGAVQVQEMFGPEE